MLFIQSACQRSLQILSKNIIFRNFYVCVKLKWRIFKLVQNTKIIEKEIELAEETYNMTNKQYRNDLATINDVLDTLTELEKAKFKMQESLFNQRRAVTALLHAKGILNY